RIPTDGEVQQAFAWANGTIEQGHDFGDRLRRHVQNIALAPWRRSMALRAEAERLGDRRLHVVSIVPSPSVTPLDSTTTTPANPFSATRVAVPSTSNAVLPAIHSAASPLRSSCTSSSAPVAPETS